MGVIRVKTRPPTLIYKEVKSLSILRGEVPKVDSSSLDKDLDNVIAILWDGFAEEAIDFHEVANVRDSLSGQLKSSHGLHDSVIECETGYWLFVQTDRAEELYRSRIHEYDPEYLGGFDVSCILSAFDSSYSLSMAKKLIDNGDLETVGNAMLHHDGYLDRFCDELFKKYGKRKVIAENFNTYDGITWEDVIVGGVGYTIYNNN